MDDLDAELMVPEGYDEYESTGGDAVKNRSAFPLVPRVSQETLRESGYHKTTRVCLRQIRDAMLHHRWQEAAEYLSYYCQSIEDSIPMMTILASSIIWRVGAEILHHHPNSEMEDYNSFYDRMKNIGVKQYLVVCLEHAFHLLGKGQLEDARRQLSIAESWRFGKQSANQSQRLNLIQAYRGYLDYFVWCEKKSTVSGTDDPDAATNQEMESYFRQSSISLKETIKTPGVWDPFVLSYIDMMEFYDDHEGVLEVLEEYAYDSRYPSNPNAHVYLYQYLKKHDFPQKKLMDVLKILHDLVPSHELTLEYCTLLLQSETPCDLQAALLATLDLLDYACWRSHLDVWNQLKDIIRKLQLIENGPAMIEEVMTPKKDWWPELHFTPFHAKQDLAQNLDMVEIKIYVEKTLCPFTTAYYDTVNPPEEEKERREIEERPQKNPVLQNPKKEYPRNHPKHKKLSYKQKALKKQEAEAKKEERKNMKMAQKRMVLKRKRERAKIKEEREALNAALKSLEAKEALEKPQTERKAPKYKRKAFRFNILKYDVQRRKRRLQRYNIPPLNPAPCDPGLQSPGLKSSSHSGSHSRFCQGQGDIRPKSVSYSMIISSHGQSNSPHLG